MDANCDKMKDQIADLISGILPETQIHTLQQHLGKCSACRDYANQLQKEDKLLAGLFAHFDAGMTGRQEEVIKAIDRIDVSGKTNVVSLSRTIMRGFFAKHAAAVAVIIIVAVYFIITLSWISEINECIRLSLSMIG